MLRPKRMSKVSVTGAKSVMDDVIESVHDANLLHVTEYDGSWESFAPGDPMAGAEDSSDKLVTVRSIESILDVDREDGRPSRSIDDEVLAERLEEVRTRVNELDDRRSALRNELGTVEERIDGLDPFVDLGIDLDLLQGYDTLQVAVGEGRREAVERSLAEAETVDSFDIREGDRTRVLAVFARPSEAGDEDALSDALVGTDFAALAVPDLETVGEVAEEGASATYDPGTYLSNLQRRRDQLETRLSNVEGDLEEVKVEAADFLLAAEEQLTIDVQKTEAPLTFATTENAFVAEGWVPTERYSDFAARLEESVGDHVEVEELERAQFSHDGHDHAREEVGGGATAGGGAPAADGGDERARADGGSVTMRNDDPPVVQDNPSFAKPFEVLVEAVSRPKYNEFDPTVILLLTFPAFFGFMIGDVGYGVLYTLIGYYLYTAFADRPAFQSMGGITIFAGLFTILFGILYGELFGLHVVGEWLFGGHPPIEKGLSPATVEWALGWLVVSVVVGILHLNVGWILDFVENVELHDLEHAVYESGSWLLMLNGLWVWVFSDALAGVVPEFVIDTFASDGVIPLGFTGFPAMEVFAIPGVGPITVPLLVFLAGFVLLIVGEPTEAIEFLNVLVNVLSYTRLAAVLLAKAGMAFTVNLLFFGVYVDSKGGWHFGLDGMPDAAAVAALGPGEAVSYHGYEVTGVLFEGLVHGGLATLLIGLVVLVFGHLLVLALGVTSAGLQAVRLEYVEFFGKFYEGGGREYEPFGYDRVYTTGD